MFKGARQAESTHRVAAWNIESGGQESYEDPTAQFDTVRVSNAIGDLAADTMIISDAFGWGEPGVLGRVLPMYPGRYFIPSDDPDDEPGPKGNIGVAIGTNADHSAPQELDLETRRGLSLTIELGQTAVDIVGAYLFWGSESSRKKSLEALMAQLDPNRPTVIAGDLNAQVSLAQASFSEKIRSHGLRLGARALRSYYQHADKVLEFEKRQALVTLDEAGFTNAARSERRPTASFKNPLTSQFRIDHIYHRKAPGDDVDFSHAKIGKLNEISDHKPIYFDIYH